MSLAGLKKQFNKANQYMSEKIGGAEHTKLADDFTEMERKTDVTNELVEDLITKTKEYLQPNPASRAKLTAATKLSKISGQTGPKPYPQPEGVLGDAMIKHGRGLGEETLFAQSLQEAGETFRQMAEVKYALEDNIRQNFLEPLTQLQQKELKDVLFHRKKLQGRRLDYDCKKRKQIKAGHHLGHGGHVTDEEIKLAEDKFEESLHLAQMGMFNLLENDVEQISQLASMTEAILEYHKQCADVVQVLVERMLEFKSEAASRPRSQYIPKSLNELTIPAFSDDGTGTGLHNGGGGGGGAAVFYPSAPPPPLPPYQHSTVGSEPRSPARSPITSPAERPIVEPLFPAGGPPPAKAAASPNASPLPSPMRSSPARTPVARQPCCQALYDFDPENEGELGFKEGDIIQLVNKIDENWFEGSIHGKKGYFPCNYVQVVVPLP